MATNVFSFRELNHLSLLGTITKPHSLVLIMNYVEGQTLHKVIFGAGVQVCYLIECNSFVSFLFFCSLLLKIKFM